MADYHISLNEDQILGLLTDNDQFKGLVESILNQILEAQMTEHIGVESYERNDNKRRSYRNGYRLRRLTTRVGHLTLRVPKTRDGHFSPSLFQRYQRHEQGFVLSLMEMYLQGVSTRKVEAVTEELCGTRFSSSTVSRLNQRLDGELNNWLNRRLDDQKYPFVLVDALQIWVRCEGMVRSKSLLVAYGIGEDGHRAILGTWLDISESETAWSRVFHDLERRGLHGVELVVSDAHKGLVRALQKSFPGVAWQRCQTHFMRNVANQAPAKHRGEILDRMKHILKAPDAATARQLSRQLVHQFEQKAPQAMRVLEQGLESALTVMQLPERYWQRLRTTNMAERTNAEIRRRERVVRIFPNEEAAVRLIGSLLMDQHEQWLTGRRYMDMTEYWEWKAKRTEQGTIIHITD
jgi:transposase-like protein